MFITKVAALHALVRRAILAGALLAAVAGPLRASAGPLGRRFNWQSGRLVARGPSTRPDVAKIVQLINGGEFRKALSQIDKVKAPDGLRGELAAAVAGHPSNPSPQEAAKAASGYLRKAIKADEKDIASRRLLHEIDFFGCGLPSKGFMAIPKLLPSRDRIYNGNFESGRGNIRDRKPKMTVFGLWCLAGILEGQPKYKKQYDVLMDDLGKALDEWDKHLIKLKARDRRLPVFKRLYRQARENEWAGVVIPKDSPLYPQVLLEHLRTYYWWWKQMGERQRPMSKQGFLELLPKMKALFPDHELTKMYEGEKVAWGQEFLPKAIPPGAPLWAVRQQELRARVDYIVQWWWNNRQAPDGSLGGGWDDDCEVLRRWSITSIICGNEGVEAGIRKLINGIWTSGTLLEGAGYDRKKRDVEHSCETSADSSVILALDYGDPLQVERFLQTTGTTDTLHTGINTHGHRHFRGITMSATFVSDDVDTLYHGRAMRPAAMIAWYTGIPRAVKLLHGYAKARSEDTVRAGRGKPAGVMPAVIRFKDEHVDGINSWVCRRYGSLYQWDAHNRDMVLGKLLGAWMLTGDDKVLDGYRAELKLIRKYMRRKDSKAPEGSEEWAARQLARWPKFATWYRVVTGDRQFDDIVRTDREYGKYLITGDPSAIVAAHEADLSYVRFNVPMVTSEVRGTDRVDLHPWSLIQALTGSPVAITEPPTFHVTWRHVDRNFAALVRNDFWTDGGSIWVYNFGDRPVRPEIRFWRLEPGMYELTVAPDANNDGKPDGPAIQTQKLEVLRRMDSARFELPAKRTYLLRVRQIQKLPALPKRMPDLAIASRDLTLAARPAAGKPCEGKIVVHNIGSADADRVRVRIRAIANGTEAARPFFETTVAKLAYPAELLAKTAAVQFTWTPKAAGTTACTRRSPAGTTPRKST